MSLEQEIHNKQNFEAGKPFDAMEEYANS